MVATHTKETITPTNENALPELLFGTSGVGVGASVVVGGVSVGSEDGAGIQVVSSLAKAGCGRHSMQAEQPASQKLQRFPMHGPHCAGSIQGSGVAVGVAVVVGTAVGAAVGTAVGAAVGLLVASVHDKPTKSGSSQSLTISSTSATAVVGSTPLLAATSTGSEAIAAARSVVSATLSRMDPTGDPPSSVVSVAGIEMAIAVS